MLRWQGKGQEGQGVLFPIWGTSLSSATAEASAGYLQVIKRRCAPFLASPFLLCSWKCSSQRFRELQIGGANAVSSVRYGHVFGRLLFGRLLPSCLDAPFFLLLSAPVIISSLPGLMSGGCILLQGDKPFPIFSNFHSILLFCSCCSLLSLTILPPYGTLHGSFVSIPMETNIEDVENGPMRLYFCSKRFAP